MASAKTWYAVELSDAASASRYPWAAFMASVNSHGHGSDASTATPTRIVLDADRRTFYTTDARSYAAIRGIPGLDDLGEVESPYAKGEDPDEPDDEDVDEGEGE